jgi:2-methylcitrate dehydratase PrpD
VVGEAFRSAPEHAAFVNGVAGHAFELDDYHLASLNHPGTVAVPAALAIGDLAGASGAQVLTAMAAGYEVMGRIGRGVAPSHLYDRGFHPQSTIGVFGAAVTAARLLDLRPGAMAHAIGLAASHAGGTVEYSQSGGESQRLHAGLAAAGGVRSALLAQGGYVAPREPLEGRFGFCRAYADRFDLALMTQDLGSRWIAEYTAFKIRPYHGMVHTAVDVALEAAGGRRLDPDAIERITIAASAHASRFLGALGSEIGSTVEAQFSLHMPVAHALLDGGTLDSMLEFNPRDERIRRLARKVEIVLDDEAERDYHSGGLRGPKFLNKVTITLADGGVLTARNYAKGSPENPLSVGELRGKFQTLAGRALPADRVTALITHVERLDQLDDVRTLTALLRTTRREG